MFRRRVSRTESRRRRFHRSRCRRHADPTAGSTDRRNEPGESQTPAGVPGNMLVPVDKCRPDGGECRGAYVQARIALNAAVDRTIGLSALGQALAQRYVAA